jgi:hypothetical protein
MADVVFGAPQPREKRSGLIDVDPIGGDELGTVVDAAGGF